MPMNPIGPIGPHTPPEGPSPGKQPISDTEAALIALKNAIRKLEEEIKPVLTKASEMLSKASEKQTPVFSKASVQETQKTSEPSNWSEIQLKESYRNPKNLPGTLSDMPWPGTDFPVTGKVVSQSYRSAELPKINGFSIDMTLAPWDRSDHPGGTNNEIAVFFNQTKHYNGGPEYGFVFRPDSKEVLFYTLTDANLKNQKWTQWSASSAHQLPKAMRDMMNSPDTRKVWSVQIDKDGNFELSISDSKTTAKCTLPKPSGFPNLTDQPGSITVLEHKWKNDDLKSDPHLKTNSVKILT